MADYNVNMKQWNGTSFDNVLPLAYNSKRLDGKTYGELPKLHLGSYVGTGSNGDSNPTTINFEVPAKIVFLPNHRYGGWYKPKQADYGYPCGGPDIVPVYMDTVPTEYKMSNPQVYIITGTAASAGIQSLVRKTKDNKKLQFFNWTSAESQLNEEGYTYYYAYIG